MKVLRITAHVCGLLALAALVVLFLGLTLAVVSAAEAAPVLVPVDSLPTGAASSVPPLHKVDCGPGGCDLPPYRLLPFRQQQQQYQQFRGQSNGNPWPTLPANNAAPAPAAVDLAPIQQQLGRISEALEDIRREARGPAAPPAAAASPPTADPTAAAALSTAHQAAETAATAKKNADEMAAKHGTLAERFEARKAEVDAKLGEHAGKLEKTQEFARSLIDDKLHALKESHGDTRLILLIVVLAVVAVVVMGIVKDVMNHNSTGDPLLVQTLATRLATQAATQPWLAPASNLAGQAAQDVTALVNQIDQRILAHKQAAAIAQATAATTPVPAAAVPAAATPAAH